MTLGTDQRKSAMDPQQKIDVVQRYTDALGYLLKRYDRLWGIIDANPEILKSRGLTAGDIIEAFFNLKQARVDICHPEIKTAVSSDQHWFDLLLGEDLTCTRRSG